MFTCPRGDLPYDPDDPASIERHGKGLEGLTVLEAAKAVGREDILGSKNGGKGKVGSIVEAWFRLKPNSRPDADFPCGLELKVAPLKGHKKKVYTSKERMVLGLISYPDIQKEEWATAHARHKLRSILVVAYKHDFTAPGRATFFSCFRWSPPASDEPQLKTDWTKTRDMVVAKRAHELSESLGRYMGPCTKGVGGRFDATRDLVKLPGWTQPAKRRAFALKASYVAVQIRKELDPTAFTRLSTPQTPMHKTEALVLRLLHKLEGKTVAAACRSLGIKVSGRDKSLAARMLNATLGLAEGSSIEELEKEGVQVKTVHARPLGAKGRGTPLQPFEAMSFPAVDFEELLDEEWSQNVGILEQLQRLLIIPTHSGGGKTAQGRRIIGRAFLWSPTTAQSDQIEREWNEIVSTVRSGGAAEKQVYNADGSRKLRKTSKRRIPWVTNDLPGDGEGGIIHMRPHGQDADDKVAVPGGRVTRQSFWLNRSFTRRLLAANLGTDAVSDGITN